MLLSVWWNPPGFPRCAIIQLVFHPLQYWYCRFLNLMIPSLNQKLKAEKLPLKWNTFFSLSPQIINAQQKHSENCLNIEMLLALEQQLALCMYTYLWHVLGNHQSNSAVYNFTHYNSCIILISLCTTAHKVPLRYMVMQQTGPVLHGNKFTHKN